ncbi:unnamed protein product [Phytophthora lilii]|uniref:Unnamed protein product n=1 Tax=Phytophthora lilii TaxID=2077276 RepID=A0A9W6TJI6_9STRA|nr:unnamed protein product [Phytophthora lilii]
MATDPAAFELNEGEIHPAIQELIGGHEMNPTRTIESCLFVDGGMPEPKAENIHILVVLPEQKAQVWQTTCSVDNSLTTNGVRYAVHRLLESHFGYYDPELLRNGLDKAMWYDGKTLRIHALFEESRCLLRQTCLSRTNWNLLRF